MDGKLNSMIHYKFNFLSFFERIWFISMQKVLIWPQKYFSQLFSIWLSQHAEFDVNFESIEKYRYQESLHKES